MLGDVMKFILCACIRVVFILFYKRSRKIWPMFKVQGSSYFFRICKTFHIFPVWNLIFVLICISWLISALFEHSEGLLSLFSFKFSDKIFWYVLRNFSFSIFISAWSLPLETDLKYFTRLVSSVLTTSTSCDIIQRGDGTPMIYSSFFKPTLSITCDFYPKFNFYRIGWKP